MNRIVVIGSCNMDIVVLADKRPTAGRNNYGQRIAHRSRWQGSKPSGGCGSSRCREVTMVGCIGEDAYGHMIIDNLKENFINTDYIVTVPNTTTGTAHITLAEGDNSIIVIAGANAKVDKSIVDNAWAAIEQADLVMVQNEIPIPTIEYIVRRCHEANVKVLLNPAPAADLDSEWLKLATYITPNEHELSALYPNQSTEEILLANENKIIVTLGSKGVGCGQQ